MIWRVVRNSAVTAFTVAALLGMIWLYDTSLRDPRVLDGWMLVAAISFQLLFSLRRKFLKLPVGQVTVWMQLHIYCGYTIVAIFAVHTQVGLPDSGFEWALWLMFVLLVISGATGAFLVCSIPAKLQTGTSQVPLENISSQQAELARQVDELVIGTVGTTGAVALTGFYTQTLHTFFRKPRNLLAHLRQSRRPLRIICGELDALDRYFDSAGKQTLHSIRNRIIKKNDLDFRYAHQGLLIVWLFIHIPATYGLVVLTIVHVAVVHAYTSGV